MSKYPTFDAAIAELKTLPVKWRPLKKLVTWWGKVMFDAMLFRRDLSEWQYGAWTAQRAAEEAASWEACRAAIRKVGGGNVRHTGYFRD